MPLFALTKDPENWERRLCLEGFRLVAGVDEVGRGSLAGPVVAASVILPLLGNFDGITDSKTLSAAQRKNLDDLIRKQAVAIGIGSATEAEIDEINILNATMKAMKVAIMRLNPQPDYVLVDGNNPIPISIPQKVMPGGDARNISIAAASIVAKVYRDALMDNYHEKYPQYNFVRNKGYATKEHLKAINNFGCCPIHRLSFRGVKEYVSVFCDKTGRGSLSPIQETFDLFKP